MCQRVIGFAPSCIEYVGGELAVGSEGAITRGKRIGRAFPPDHDIEIRQHAGWHNPPVKLTGNSLPRTMVWIIKRLALYARRLDLLFVMAEVYALPKNVRN